MKTYSQSHLDQRFDRESLSWKTLYQGGQSVFRYADKQYRRHYTIDMLPNDNSIVLDLGCGSGSFLEALSEKSRNVVGVDTASEMVNLAKQESDNIPKSAVVQGNALQLPFEDNTFSGMIAVGLLEYLPDDEAFLKEVKRIVMPGGTIVLTLRNADCIERNLWKKYKSWGINKYNTNYYYREHHPKEFRALLDKLGFEHDQSRFCHFYPLPWPVSRFLKPVNAPLSHLMERYLSSANIDVLGSTYIVSFRTPGALELPKKDKALQSYYRCPLTQQSLKPATAKQLQALNEKEEAPLEAALVTEDGQQAYPVKSGIPSLLPEAVIQLT